jgi:hypothetical protein
LFDGIQPRFIGFDGDVLIDDLFPAQKPGAGVAAVCQRVKRAPTLRRKLLCKRFGQTLVGAAMPHVNIHNLAFMETKAPRASLHSHFLRRRLKATTLALSERQGAAKFEVQL